MANGFAGMEIETGAGKYLRVKGGDSVDFHIISEHPVKKIVHGFGAGRVICIGADKNCPACVEGETPKQRWLINVWDRKDSKVKIYEFGPSIAKQFKALAEMLAEDQKTVNDVDIRIKAEGSGMDTEYTVMQKAAGPDVGEVEEWPL